MLYGDLKGALALAEQAHYGNPDFRPPLRYLIALYASQGEDEKAIRAASKLADLEPDFTIDRLLLDDDYPASLIKRVPGLSLDRLSYLF